MQQCEPVFGFGVWRFFFLDHTDHHFLQNTYSRPVIFPTLLVMQCLVLLASCTKNAKDDSVLQVLAAESCDRCSGSRRARPSSLGLYPTTFVVQSILFGSYGTRPW
jgi:hypothetical protein